MTRRKFAPLDPDDSEAAKIVSLVTLCQAMNTLPRVGGLLDQDPMYVLGAELVLKAQAEQQEKELTEAKRKADSASRRT